MSPSLSIIIPMFNRERFIGRALHSCLSQTFQDFEVVVVDDASTDGSVEAVNGFADPRILLLRHERNRGRCPARNTAMAAARGGWFVFLDSDDELLPGALETIHQRARGACDGVGSLRFMCVDEAGTSPLPPHRDEVLDYPGFLRLLDPMIRSGRGEALPCSRASTFPAVRYRDSHAPEGSYHLDMARSYGVETRTEVVRRYHHDAENQITVPSAQRALRYAADEADDIAATLASHGAALAQWAPESYLLLQSGGALASFLAGRRRDGLRYSAAVLRRSPLAPTAWIRMAAGIVSARAVAELQVLKHRMRR